MILVSKTYLSGIPFWFRRITEDARHESVVLRAHDMRQIRGLYWTSSKNPAPKVGIVVMHPRVDFTHHYAVPRLVSAGFAVLASNTRHVGNDTMAEHEEMVLDLAACVRHLRERRGISKVVLFGNCGGASLAAYYQAEARLPPAERTRRSPGGSPTFFDSADLVPAQALVYVSPHRGQGKVMLDCIDPSITDERDPLSVDPWLDMYDERNGFRPPPESSRYDAAFLERYRRAQVDRVARLDAVAKEYLAHHALAKEESECVDFGALPFGEQRAILLRRVADPIMVVYRTMANPSFVDLGLDSSDRDYGSLLSERPDLMNAAALGLGRTCTPRAWLSTWSGLSSRASLVDNVARIAEPTLIAAASADREVLPRTDIAAIAAAVASEDKRVVTVAGARHYFEPEPGGKESPHVEQLMDVVIPWIEERTA